MPRKTITVKYGVEMKEPRRIPPWLKMLLVIALVVGVISLAHYFVVWILTPTEEDVAIINATPTVKITPTVTVNITPTPTVRPDPTVNPELSYELSSVSQLGDHIKAWVYIPGLGLDTVISQWKDNFYFRDADINLNANSLGAVYLDYRSDPSYIREAGNIVIYGNNNLGGRQLKSLLKYVNEDYFDRNNLIIFETMYGSYNFRIFSVHIEEDDDKFVEPVSSKKMDEFIKELIEVSMFEPENVPENDSVILTFSVDVESAKGTRYLVHAFLEES